MTVTTLLFQELARRLIWVRFTENGNPVFSLWIIILNTRCVHERLTVQCSCVFVAVLRFCIYVWIFFVSTHLTNPRSQYDEAVLSMSDNFKLCKTSSNPTWPFFLEVIWEPPRRGDFWGEFTLQTLSSAFPCISFDWQMSMQIMLCQWVGRRERWVTLCVCVCVCLCLCEHGEKELFLLACSILPPSDPSLSQN